MKRKYLYIILALVGVAVLSLWLTREPKQKAGAETVSASSDQNPMMEVNGQVISGQPYSNTLTLSGTLEPDEQIQIRSEISGVIRELAFEEGSMVKKGQLLLRIDDSELQARLLEAQTREKLASENEQRARQLLEKEAISQQEYDVSLAEFESSKAQKSLIDAQLAKTRVHAPFSGQVGLRSVSVGEYLTPATVVANLVNAQQVKVQFSMPEKYSGMINRGHPVSIRASYMDTDIPATVYAIEPGIDETTRTIQIRAIADNESGVLVPGSFARVRFPLDQIDDAILIPTYAVTPIQDGKQVYVLNNGKVDTTSVVTEARTDANVLVTEGLRVGDTLITSGMMTIRVGMPVQVRVIE